MGNEQEWGNNGSRDSNMCSLDVPNYLTTYCCVRKRTTTDSFNKKVSSMKCLSGSTCFQLLNLSCPSQSTDLLPCIWNGSVSLTRYSHEYGKVDKPFSRGQSSNINVFIIFKRWHFCPTLITMHLSYIKKSC